jgi:hypothetical protein
MNSESNTVARSASRLFSDRALLHYFLAIIITSIAASLFLSFRTYECLHSGNDYDCKYSPDSPAMVAARGAGPPDVLWVLRTTALISTFHGLFSILSFFILCAPIYAIAYYAGRRCAVRRNIVGIAFWIAAWTLAFLSLPILLGIRALFDPGHTSWAADLSGSYFFAMCGLFCGIVYCALAFLHRDKTVES